MDDMVLIFYKLVKAAQTKFHLKFFCIFLAFMSLAAALILTGKLTVRRLLATE